MRREKGQKVEERERMKEFKTMEELIDFIVKEAPYLSKYRREREREGRE